MRNINIDKFLLVPQNTSNSHSLAFVNNVVSKAINRNIEDINNLKDISEYYMKNNIYICCN